MMEFTYQTQTIDKNNLSSALEHQLQLDNNVSCCSQVDLLSAKAWHPTLLEVQPSGH